MSGHGSRTCCAVALVVLALPARAAAGPGLTLPPGDLQVAVNLEMNVSKDTAFDQVSIAPDVAYGVTPALTVALIHSTFGVTGFRGAAGGGLCVTGAATAPAIGCPEVYDNVGAEAWYSLARGSFSAAVVGGAHALGFERGFYAAKAGAKLRYTAGDLYVVSLPSVLVAVTERDATPANDDSLWLPVVVNYKVLPALALGVGSGLKGPLDGFGDRWTVSLGFFGQYTVDPRTALGASLVFGRALAGDTVTATGADTRVVQLWASYTFR